ncbi:MAG: hypothetical protein Q7S63_03365 [bacterium]|nr:hypothetical protein [bacterium]
MAEYTQEQLEQTYEKLPDELQEAIFSVQTADAIRTACEKQGITDARVGEVAADAGLVLMGLLMPEDFPGAIEKKVGLQKDALSQLAHEINRFIFFPVKESLSQIHIIVQGKPSPSRAPATAALEEQAPKVARQPETPKRGRPRKSDTYLEKIDEE